MANFVRNAPIVNPLGQDAQGNPIQPNPLWYMYFAKQGTDTNAAFQTLIDYFEIRLASVIDYQGEIDRLNKKIESLEIKLAEAPW